MLLNIKTNNMKARDIIMMVVGGMLLAACGGSKKPVPADSDTLGLEPEAAVDSVMQKQTAYLTKDSIGGIHIGMSINEVPDSIPGLYAAKENGASEDAVTITFSDPDGEKFIAYDFGEGVVDVVNVIGRDVKVKAPRGEFGLGDKFSKVLELPGVAEEWSGYDGNGSWYWVWEGLWFAPSHETLTDVLSRRLYNSQAAPTRADFNEDVTIGFIGTGLPF